MNRIREPPIQADGRQYEPKQPNRTEQLLALDEALGRLARLSERQAKVIELHYFGGLTLQEMSDLLGASPPTLSRDKKMAEAWLGHTLAGVF